MSPADAIILGLLAIAALVTVLVDHPRFRRALIIALIALAMLLVSPMVAWVSGSETSPVSTRS